MKQTVPCEQQPTTIALWGAAVLSAVSMKSTAWRSRKVALWLPQRAEHAGRLTVVLDLDGTLLSSFTPRRAPVLPPGSTAYIMGRGGRLNPNGVFVVERPGLTTFFDQLSKFAGAHSSVCIVNPSGSRGPIMPS